MVHVKDWHHTDIIKALHNRGTSLEKISQEACLKPCTLHNTLNRNWPKGEKLIADALNLPPSTIWPTRYLRRASLLSDR